MVDGDARAVLGVRLLGEVAVEHGDRVTPRGSRSLQTLLAVLALRAGAVVDTDVLVAEVWSDGVLPQHPLATLHTAMSRLRDWLHGPPDLLNATSGGYVLGLSSDQVDLARFHAAADGALAPRAHPSHVVRDAELARRIWRGDPFPGLHSARLSAAREHARLRHQLLLEARVGALIALDRAAEAVDAVLPLAASDPDREVLHALLVEALHRAGRPREAVEAYLAARRHLLDELGVEPGPELRAAYRRVLEERSGPSPAAPAARPLLVGRDAALTTVLDDRGLGESGRVLVVEGEAGIGKSVLLEAARHDADARGAATLVGVWDEDGSPVAAWFAALDRPPVGLSPHLAVSTPMGRRPFRRPFSRHDGCDLTDRTHRAYGADGDRAAHSQRPGPVGAQAGELREQLLPRLTVRSLRVFVPRKHNPTEWTTHHGLA